jgi:mannose-6-phosphate isomerase
VPAGTIHAIGAGLVIAELQQRSDATFRLFDFGRQRELQIENAIVVAETGPASFQVRPKQLTAERRLLVSSPYFVLERINLAQNSSWYLDADQETWLLVLSGSATAGSFDVATGDALFAQSDRVDIRPGAMGMVGLVAYTGDRQVPNLLQRLPQPGSMNVSPAPETQVSTSLPQVKNLAKAGRVDMTK